MNSAELGLRKEKRKINKEKRQKKAVLVIACLAMLILTPVIVQYKDSFRQRPLNTSAQPRIYFMGKESSAAPLYIEEGLYLSLAFVKENLDPALCWDEKNGLVIITTPADVYHLTAGSKQGLHNLRPYEMENPLVRQEDNIYFPAGLIAKLYKVEIKENKEQGFVSIRNMQKLIQTGKTCRAGRIRLKPHLKSPWIEKIETGEDIEIFWEENGWYRVYSGEDSIGYLQKSAVVLNGIDNKASPVSSAFQPFNPPGQPILLTWEFVLQKTVNTRNIGELGGVHVLSPTWFHLREDGKIYSTADKKYVDWAHGQGRQVWGVFSSDCQIDLTHTFLSDAGLRMKAQQQLLEYVDEYELDGIDIDFEYMYMEDKEAYVQFIRELTPLMHETGRTVTVYVIFHSSSERWSRCYDHKKLAEIADYLIVMAYDQHTVMAGSVASLPWVEQGLVRMLEDVPPDKLLLGVPFYTRLWKEDIAPDGSTKTSRRTFTMEQAEKWIREQGLEIKEDISAGQHYVEYIQSSTTYRMWLEDFYSLEKRVALMKKYRLAGLAAWRRGIEKEQIWPVLTGLIDKRW